eukprot:2639410-Alexandrium_andersonii.AAC.1
MSERNGAHPAKRSCPCPCLAGQKQAGVQIPGTHMRDQFVPFDGSKQISVGATLPVRCHGWCEEPSTLCVCTWCAALARHDPKP